MVDSGYVYILVVTQLLTKTRHLKYNIVMMSLQSLVINNVD